jgi:hypothetical protein
MKDVKEGTPGEDDAASTSTKKRITREERKDEKIRRSRDGKWTRKNNTPHFGNKIHTVRGNGSSANQGIRGYHSIIARFTG